MKKVLVFATLITLILFVIGIRLAFAQFSTNYRIQKHVTDQGGAASQSNNYQIGDAVGQPSPVSFATSNNYIVSSGFWGGGIMVTGVDEKYEVGIPDRMALLPAYPNPFNPSITIPYQLSDKTKVYITVFDILGRRVRYLVNGIKQDTGVYTISWDGKDNQGKNISSGTYIINFKTENFVKSQRVILVR